MAARTRWRRKLTVAGLDFLWYVADDPDGQGPIIHLFTPDKTLAVTYKLQRGAFGYPDAPYLVIRDRGRRIATPQVPDWPRRTVATPAFVREVAEWTLSAVGHPPSGPA